MVPTKKPPAAVRVCRDRDPTNENRTGNSSVVCAIPIYPHCRRLGRLLLPSLSAANPRATPAGTVGEIAATTETTVEGSDEGLPTTATITVIATVRVGQTVARNQPVQTIDQTSVHSHTTSSRNTSSSRTSPRTRPQRHSKRHDSLSQSALHQRPHTHLQRLTTALRRSETHP